MKHMLKISAVYLIGNPKSVTCGHPYLRILLPFVFIKSLKNLSEIAEFPNGIFDFGSLCREEFSEMFGVAQQKYQKLREELDCEKAFPHVYEKISKLGRS